ncbi:alpha/beta hydrolase [Dyadobacter sp. LJ53]|uniref:alpha/beta fold hydrolase n=1 Tax=Dyadobacter chenwenxiniae TaxID=2906456 RepID=UPI001F3D26D6|nr:alpha/beta hydrolase [Dyadobacter chenwenxiniae]MCF0049029.1 alpha/beta hydrolase [Dyadobacter chenwenxiniae]
MKKEAFIILIFLFIFCEKGICEKLLPVEKQIKISDDLTLHYVEQGAPDGDVVILLHGYSDSWHSYELVLPLLPKSLHVYAVSMRGHGNSSKPDGSYHPDVLAGDIAGFMQKLGIHKAAVVGHSLGATVAQSFATHYTEKTAALVLAGAFAHFNKKVIYDFKSVVDSLQDPVDAAFAHEFQKSTLYRPVSGHFFETVVNESTKLPVRVWKAAVSAMITCNYLDNLQQISVPTLLIWGDQDVFTPIEDQQLLHKAIKGSKLRILKKVGHAVHWEEPERFSKDLVAFLGEAL